jgi:hypothetical protein
MNATKDPLNGRFSPSQAAYGVTEIHLPNNRIGYRVGSSGRIYANREHAVNHALCRRPKTVTSKSKVRFDSARPAKATKSRLEAFGQGLEPEATQEAGEAQVSPQATTDAPESPVCETCSAEPIAATSAAKPRSPEDRHRRVQEKINRRESAVREAHRRAFTPQGTPEERKTAWPLFRKWDRRREWAQRAYHKAIRRERPFRDIRGDWTGD